MSSRKRFLFLLGIMTMVAVAVGIATIVHLYDAAFEQASTRLQESAQSSARFLEGVARFDQEHSISTDQGDAFEATLRMMRDVHSRFRGSGESGEFLLAKLEEDQIVWLLRHHHPDLAHPAPILITSDLAEPMRLALSGHAGTVVGLDYRGATVLAAHEPVAVLNLGIVAKMDMEEIRAPFIRAGFLAGGTALFLVLLGATWFYRVGMPLVRNLEKSEKIYRLLVENMNDGLGMVTKDGRFEYINPAYRRMLGRTENELIGLRVEDLLDEANRSIIQEQSVIRKQGGNTPYEIAFTRKDGRQIQTRVSPTPLFSGDNSFAGSLVVVTDITKKIEYEKALREAEEKYRAVFNHAAESIVLIEPESGKFLEFNTEAHNNLGYTLEEFQKLTVADIEARESLEEIEARVRRIRKSGFDKFEAVHLTKNGKERNTLVSVRMVSLRGRIILISMWHDITQLKQAEKSIRSQHRFLQHVIDSLTYPFYVVNARDHKVVLANSACRESDLTTDLPCYQMLHGRSEPCDSDNMPCPIKKVLKTGKSASVFQHDRSEEGRERYLQVSAYPVLDDWQNVNEVIIYSEDVTESKLAEKAQSASLKEKEILLKEIHHRVKNNLQIISSLLSIQSGHVQDDATTAVLQQSQSRVNSMSLIHEQLYKSSDLARVDMAEYVDSLLTGIAGSYGIDTERISIENRIKKISLDIDTAVPCGLMITELVSNAFKHAFPHGRTGQVRVDLTLEDEMQVLTVSDTGVGIPSQVDWRNPQSLGLQLVCLLSKQLGGSVDIQVTDGTTTIVRFPKERAGTQPPVIQETVEAVQ